MTKLLSIILLILMTANVAHAQQSIATLRENVPLAENGDPVPFPKVINNDLRQVRNYPEQPPLIPHKIDGYQIDTNFNQCLECHRRAATGVTQAPMVSITHFMNRDNQFLASVTPRRYFCTQCHVVQSDSLPLVENTFLDVDSVLEYLDAVDTEDE